IGEEGQLPAIAARGSHQVRLVHISEARADQNFSARRVPILKARASEFGVAPDRFGDAHGDRRDAVYDEVFVWGDVRPLGQGDDGYEQRQTSQHRAASEAGAEQSSKPLQNPKLSVADVDRSGRYNAALIVQQLEFERLHGLREARAAQLEERLDQVEPRSGAKRARTQAGGRVTRGQFRAADDNAAQSNGEAQAQLLANFIAISPTYGRSSRARWFDEETFLSPMTDRYGLLSIRWSASRRIAIAVSRDIAPPCQFTTWPP